MSKKKENVTPHRVFGRTKGAMHEELLTHHLAHYKSLHPSVRFSLFVVSLLMVVLSMLLSSTVVQVVENPLWLQSRDTVPRCL